MPTFSELAVKPNTTKIVLVEIDIQQTSFWTVYQAGIWYVNFDNVYPDVDSSLLTGVSSMAVTQVGSVQMDDELLTEVAGVALVISTEKSFYYSKADNELYIHLTDWDEPSIHRILIGIVYGITNREGVYDDHHYEGRLKGAPSISKERDPLFFGKIAFEGGSVRIDNADGYFDRWGEDNEVFGNPVRIYVGFPELTYANYSRVFSGIIDSLHIGDSMVVTVRDERKKFSKTIPDRFLNQTDYPDLNDSNVGAAVPVVFGTVKNAKAICLNEDEAPTPTNYEFIIADTTYHRILSIDAVNVDGASVTPASTDVNAGTFEVAATDYTAGDEVTVDLQGEAIDDGGWRTIDGVLEYIRYILDDYLGIPYDAAHYDTVEWGAAEAASPDGGLFLDTPTEITRIIEFVAQAYPGVFLVQDDGKYTYKVEDSSDASVQTLTKEDLLNVPAPRYESREILTSARIGHTKRWTAGTYRWVIDDDEAEAIYNKFKVYRQRDFPTILVSAADAQDAGDTIMELAGELKKTIPIVTDWRTIERELSDVITVEISRPNPGYSAIGNAKVRIIGITKDLDSFQVNITGRIMELVS